MNNRIQPSLADSGTPIAGFPPNSQPSTFNDLSRRQILQTMAACGLWFSLPGLTAKAAEDRGPKRAKSLITVWLAGGPSQLETWDPHPGTTIGGPTKAIETSIAGASICSDYPRIAEQLKHFSVIRSMVSKEGDHERGSYFLKTGYRPEPTVVHPSIAAILAKELADPTIEIPQNIALGDVQFRGRGGYLGNQYDAFQVFEPGANLHNLKSYLSDDRQQRRLAGLEMVSKTFARGRKAAVEATLHQHTLEAALRMMRSEQLKAFDLTDEPQAVKDSYGDNSFGRGCLVARRLVEQGVRSIEVTLTGFDSHAENFTFHRRAAAWLDPGLAALTKELVERDLWQSTIVLVLGEFGRTPNINPFEGRDHWPTGFSCLLGGGGLASGQVIGATDPTGEKTTPEDPVEVADLYATILSQMGVNPDQEVITPIGRPIKFSEGKLLDRLRVS